MADLEHIRARLGERYSIERELGRGGMGAVYLARDVRLDRPVAIKVLPSEYAMLPALRERFLRESRTAAGFSHPNIVPVYAVEESSDFLAYVMGFVEGESLAERVNRAGTLNPREAVKLLQDVGYALAYAHGKDVVHRDIKPDNIMIERATGRALVMDFGIARPIAAAPADAEGLTRVGEVVGTPEYMSPEQATGDAVDGRSDIYALGLTAHFALIGTPAFSGGSIPRVLARQITEELPSMATLRGDVPPALATVIDRCVAKEPDARYQRAEELVEELDAAQLSAPEIPLALRLFANEASTLLMIVLAVVVISFFLIESAAQQNFGSIDTLIPVVALVGVLVARVMQTFREARRLGSAGFSVQDVERGLAAVIGERQTRRLELRQDAATRQARKRTVVWGGALLALALLMIRGAFLFRTQVGPRSYTIAPQGTVLILSGMTLLGISLVLVLRSPFRMPITERLFRGVWLGPLGRAFVRMAVRRGGDAAVMTSHTAAPASAGRDRIAALEKRVSALERRSEGARSG